MIPLIAETLNQENHWGCGLDSSNFNKTRGGTPTGSPLRLYISNFIVT